ncbi:interferon-induced transmembrane protein [Plakobranchus ocellatus]|uniref:Interferon-induced transmembrane protein n=1 Tax=Plakobranchus ocellatus TaxID=259542 RepID=A0AAV4A281_9GAST|nr:interferon-induced transmembrane protein [Plakobranchus ocellatus]
MDTSYILKDEQPPPYDDPAANAQLQQPYPQQPQPHAQYGYGYGHPVQQQQTNQNTVVVMSQPTPQPAPVYVQDNMVISIVSIFFCCLCGIIATVQASDSRNALRRGDISSAQRLSRTARKWAITGIVVGCILAGLTIVFPIIGALIAASSSTNDDY